jgi:hypothetical protein
MNNTETIFSDRKVKITGNIVSFFTFGGEFRVAGGKLYSNSKKEKPKPLTSDEIRKKNLKRAQRTVKDLVNSNINRSSLNSDKFLTLTQADFESDITKSNAHLHRFMVRLNRHLSPSIKKSNKGEAELSDNVRYLAVPEFQKKHGTVHYHLVLFGMPYLNQAKIAQLWGRGYVWINRIHQGSDVGAYMTKYMVKDIGDPRLRGEKCYMASKGLEKPLMSTLVEMVNYVYGYVKQFAKPAYLSDPLPIPFLKSVVVEKFSLWRYPKEVRYLKRTLALGSLS